MSPRGRSGRGMEWLVMIELSGANGTMPWHETTHRWTTQVGSDLEPKTLSRPKTQRAVTPSETTAVSIHVGHCRARGHQGGRST
jgi:hypothetical protein